MGAAAILSGLLTEIMIPAAAVVGIAFALVQFVAGLRAGATSFLFTEYQYVGIFMVAFAVLIFLFLGSVEGFSTKAQPCAYSKDKYCKPALANAGFSTISFLLGATTSLVSGFLGMKIATYANARTTLEARKGVGKAFIIAFRSGAVMGFLLAANGFLVLYIAINLFKLYYGDDWEGLFESITGYGLGGSSMALFGRVGGGIYTKAADVGADLVAATNVISGLALGYKSVIIAIFAIAVSIFVSFSLAAMYGIAAAAALGMLSTIATGLAIDAYGPISDNAGGMAEMAGMSHRIRERTDALDAAGNTTTAIGKVAKMVLLLIAFPRGFAIGSAALVSLALFGAFVSRAAISTVDVLTPKVFIGLIVGAMLPYWFSAMTMKSVGSAALKMVEEVRRQFNTILGLMDGSTRPDYATCVKISTDASIKEMIPPGALVMLTPLIVGTFFGVETLSGFLLGHLFLGCRYAEIISRLVGVRCVSNAGLLCYRLLSLHLTLAVHGTMQRSIPR
ncbi:hypothetical protein B296_00032960 [Ensete ventricosum]|uniref:H(+)-exporting diphosphatase n=1 Tax=Ensete ventricosum TaxID=4639 RepID=A0A426YJL5_ENSVE|nr:hypothetical protein B296_00032960 [Ensete ventricosum]